MLLVWSIAKRLLQGEPQARASASFVAALLYIISPAGVFLSAPYTESPFAMLNMLGIRLFLLGKDMSKQNQIVSGALATMAGGIASGLATVVRSNGILNGILYAWDALSCLLQLLQDRASFRHICRLFSLGVGGCMIAAGMVLPQYQAYREYCSGPDTADHRPWCSDRFPSIFTFVQAHYW
jgi:GPI mannosyltransferase 2